MSRIILIETSTSLCSVALASQGRIVQNRQLDVPKSHASMTAVFVKEILDAEGIGVQDCDAVCLSSGPGSYTGLRVGSSTAKGLCFASGKGLIAVETLEVLAYQALEDGIMPPDCRYIVPMIDARRMEVYTTVFNSKMEKIRATEALVLEEDSFAEFLDEGEVLFIGDGVEKFAGLINEKKNAYFAQTYPRADAMLKPAYRELEKGNFQDIAYFEPFYLKQFQVTVSKKKII